MNKHNIFLEIPRTPNTRIIHTRISAYLYYRLPIVSELDWSGNGKTTIEETCLGCICEHGYRFGYSHRCDIIIIADEA